MNPAKSKRFRLFASRTALVAAGSAVLLGLPGAADDADVVIVPVQDLPATPRGVVQAPAVLVIAQPDEAVTSYEGEEWVTPVIEVWKPICGSDTSAATAALLKRSALDHQRQFQEEDGGIVIDTTSNLVGPNLVFHVASSVPAAAIPAIAAVEAYVESLFTDPVTVTINISFAPLAPGVLGSTSATFLTASYASSRFGLVNHRDSSDTIQPKLPTGTTVAVRYNGDAATVTNENRVFWTRANFKATVGSSAGIDSNMQFGTGFSFDFDPGNGVLGTSFRDVLVHEIGHCLGIYCGADFLTNDMTTLDLFRFQYTDGSADYNPDTVAEFTTRPRLVSKNRPNDAQIFDIISAEYRMSDGSPYQASHLREQTPSLGLMDPAIGTGTTNAPSYYKTSDLTMLDAIGWSR